MSGARDGDAVAGFGAGQAAARGVALFLGAFSLLNVLGGIGRPGFDANLWWIDLRPMAPAIARALLAVAGAMLLAWAIRPKCRPWRRVATLGLAAFLLIAALENCLHFLGLIASRRVSAGSGIPLSLLVAAALSLVIFAVWRAGNEAAPGRWRSRLAVAAATGACAVAFPIAQMFCFGLTDYSRPVDAIVVFGARAYADGRPSSALEDRVVCACDLYQRGLAGRLIFSGGPGDGAVHETEAMRTLALKRGVPDEAIVLDPAGVNTAATVRNTAALFEREGIRRVMAVSHFYHLPRIKMSYQRAGWEVYTVPVERPLRGTPLYMAREVAALWVYYLRGS